MCIVCPGRNHRIGIVLANCKVLMPGRVFCPKQKFLLPSCDSRLSGLQGGWNWAPILRDFLVGVRGIPRPTPVGSQGSQGRKTWNPSSTSRPLPPAPFPLRLKPLFRSRRNARCLGSGSTLARNVISIRMVQARSLGATRVPRTVPSGFLLSTDLSFSAGLTVVRKRIRWECNFPVPHGWHSACLTRSAPTLRPRWKAIRSRCVRRICPWRIVCCVGWRWTVRGGSLALAATFATPDPLCSWHASGTIPLALKLPLSGRRKRLTRCATSVESWSNPPALE